MNAPFGWPTTYPLPKFCTKRVAITGLGFLVVACSENVTSPGGHAAPPIAVATRVAGDVIVMERTTTDATSDGHVGVVHTSRKVMTPQLRAAGDLRARASASPASSPSPSPASFDGFPLPPLALPARREAAMCSDLPAWSERAKGAGGRDVVSSGIGDTPASTIKVEQADGSTWTIERHWTRTATSWQLDRQVTTGARGYHDVVTYRHETADGKLASNAIPSATCAIHPRLTGMPSNSISKSLYAPHADALSAIFFPREGTTGYSCDGGGDEDCYGKQISVYRDDIAIVVTATVMAAACMPPAVILAAPCVGATVAYLGAVAALKLDVMALQHCLEQPVKPTPVSLVAPGATPLSEASVLGGIPKASASRVGVFTTALSDCGAFAGDHCHWDVWEISYDGGDTWEYFDTFLICDDAM